MSTTNGILLVGFVVVFIIFRVLLGKLKTMEEEFSGRLEKIEAHVRFWSFYLGPLGDEARIKKEAALEKEYERLAGFWDTVDKGDSAKMKDFILAAYKAYQNALSDRWDDMLVLNLVDAESWDQQREHRWEMERLVAKDPAYGLRLDRTLPDLKPEQANSS